MTVQSQNNLNKNAIAKKWGLWGAICYCGMFLLSILLGIIAFTLVFNSDSLAAPLLIIIILYLFAWIGSITVNLIAAIKYKEINNPLCILFGFFAFSIIGLIIFLVVYMSANNFQQNMQNYPSNNDNQLDRQDSKDNNNGYEDNQKSNNK